MKYLKLIAILLFSLISFSTVFGNSLLFSTIQRTCSTYHMSVDFSMMSLIDLPDGSQELNINLSSSRNNYDKSLLVGFYAAGKAIKQLDLNIAKVTIVVAIEYKEVQQFMATANKADILAYVNEKISYSEFMKRIAYN